MAIIRDYKLGNIRIKVDDQYCQNQTDEELQQIIQNVSDITYRQLLAQHLKEQEKIKEKNQIG